MRSLRRLLHFPLAPRRAMGHTSADQAEGALGRTVDVRWERRFHLPMRSRATRRRGIAAIVIIIGATMSTFAVHSCTSAKRTILAPPQIAGADFVGSSECADCHAQQVRDLPGTTHALLTAQGKNAVAIGCESCHGPGSLHVDSGGERNTIINPSRDPRVCFQCHLGAQAEFSLPHSHPVTSGPLGTATAKMACADCHDPHRGTAVARGSDALLSLDDGCVSCHPAQRGPFVFEHEAMREGCTACHQPHGSVNPKMLTERNANLCLKCHMQPQLAEGTFDVGGRDHSLFLTQGTCNSAGCHEAVHGSQVSPSLRF